MGGLPATAAWRHVEARAGFEVVFITTRADGLRADGHVTAVEDGQAWAVSYSIEIDDRWRTRSAVVRSASELGERELHVEADGEGSWRADGAPAGQVEGCLDIDLEASAFTNALPVHRLRLDARPARPRRPRPTCGLRTCASSGSSRATSGSRTGPTARAMHYESPAFDFAAELAYDRAGLVLDYPGIAVRVA